MKNAMPLQNQTTPPDPDHGDEAGEGVDKNAEKRRKVTDAVEGIPGYTDQ